LDALEEIRMLSNFQVKTHSLVQTLLVGQPELRARMKDPRRLQIAQRIALNYHIAALARSCTSWGRRS
jgi:type II secretory pathway predicted ATPase ExeA